MRFLIRALLFLLVLGAIVAGAGYVLAGTQAGPSMDVRSPEKFVGQMSPLEFFVEAPGGTSHAGRGRARTGGPATAVFSIDPAQPPAADVKAGVGRPAVGRSGRSASRRCPSLKAGPGAPDDHRGRGRCSTACATIETRLTRDLEVRLEPPRVGVVSLHHFVNHGGAEFVVFRATPPDVTAGVRVGEVAYPAFPGEQRRHPGPGDAGRRSSSSTTTRI